MKISKIFLPIIALLLPVTTSAMTLTLEKTIELANDSSLMAFRYRNMYQASYWQYVSFKANRLPSLSLTATPARYYRYMTQRYDSEQNIDIFRQQQMFSASAGLEVTQNFDLLGGSLYLETDLEYMRNFGQNKYTQYSSVPVRIGYRQDLLGFNAFKWERKIEPLRYEKAKKELIYNMESVSEQAVSYFFAIRDRLNIVLPKRMWPHATHSTLSASGVLKSRPSPVPTCSLSNSTRLMPAILLKTAV